MKPIRDLTGMRFGRLTAIKFSHRHKRETIWECKCDCGNTHFASSSHLLRGHTKSCGCFRKEELKRIKTRHGETNTRLHRIWDGMIRRCRGTSDKKNNAIYHDRGITVCKEWEVYENFRDWSLANGYDDGLTIDRIDTCGNYCPENCRWVTMKVQQNNKRNNHYIEFEGKRQTIGEWATEKNIPYDTLYNRIYIGWTMEKALSVPFWG